MIFIPEKKKQLLLFKSDIAQVHLYTMKPKRQLHALIQKTNQGMAGDHPHLNTMPYSLSGLQT